MSENVAATGARSTPESARDFDRLYGEYHLFVRRALRRHYVDPSELDDVTQEVFVVLLQRLDEARSRRQAGPWLFQVARRVAANYHRGRRRRERKHDAFDRGTPSPSAAYDAEDRVARREAWDALREFMESLDDEACAVFVMSEVEGLRGAEIASRLGISLSMTYARVRTVRARFQRNVVRSGRGPLAALVAGPGTPVLSRLGTALAVSGRLKAAIVTAILVAAAMLWLVAGRPGGGSGGGPAGADAPPTAPMQLSSDGDRRAGSGARGEDAGVSTDEGSASFRGEVVDPQGAPIARASVCGDRIALPDHRLTAPPRCTITDDKGQFDLGGMLSRAHTLEAFAAGFRPGRYHGPPAVGLRIVLNPGGVELSGIVVDAHGGPIEGAWVAVENRSETSLGATVRTDASGAFSLWVVEGAVSLAAGAQDYSSKFTPVVAPSTTIEIELSAESVISGVVVDKSEQPVAEARVSALLLPGWERYANRGASVFSDAEGRWEIRGLQPGVYVMDGAGARSWGRAEETIDLGIGDHRSDIRIKMVEGAEIVAKIVDEDTGAPCTEGFATTLDDAQSIVREGATAGDGSIEIASLTGDAVYKVTVGCRDYATREFDVDLRSDPGVQRWALRRGNQLRVRVVDPQREPLADWTVRLRHPEGHNLFDHRPAGQFTDEDGHVVFTGLVDGTHRIMALGAGAPPIVWSDVEVAGAETNLVLTASASSEVVGTVHDGDGNPVAGALVTLQAPEPEFDKRVGPTKAQVKEMLVGGPFRAVTDVAGAFRCASVRAGQYDVWVLTKNAALAFQHPDLINDSFQRIREKPLRSVTVGADRVQLALRVDRLASISGVVEDDEGDVLADVRIYAVREHEGRVETPRGRPVLSGTNGEFRLDDLLPGAYTLTAYRAGGGVLRRGGIKAGSKGAKLVFERSAGVSGRVLNADGRAAKAFRVFVTAEGSDKERFIPFGSDGGAFRVNGLAAGRYTIGVTTPESRASVNVELAAGEQRTGVELTLAPRTHLRGRLVDGDGEPVEGWIVVALPPGAERLPENVLAAEQTHTDGTFLLEDVPERPVAILAGPEATPEAFADVPELRVIDVEKDKTNEAGDIRVVVGSSP